MKIDKEALYVVNHSGGKDSQAMYLYLRGLGIPDKNMVVIHAHLPEVEWDGTLKHIEDTVTHELFVVQSGKTFFEMVEHRKQFPSAQNRQCTSDLKRHPINKKVIELCNTRGYTKVVNCMGLRAQESTPRAAKPTYKKSASNSNGKRVWYEWLPIHKWKKEQVFASIAAHGQKPHWAYEKGMSRLSCVFCIMSKKSDLQIAAKHNPELLKKYNEVERRLDHTLIMPSKSSGKKFLTEIVSE